MGRRARRPRSSTPSDGYSYVDQVPGAPFDSLDFVPVPEPKTVKNRIHLDVTTADVDALVAAGATVLRAQDDDDRLDRAGRPGRQRVLRLRRGR